MARRYPSGTLAKLSSSSPETRHFCSTVESSAANSTMRSSYQRNIVRMCRFYYVEN
jgi:hypothetical protein